MKSAYISLLYSIGGFTAYKGSNDVGYGIFVYIQLIECGSVNIASI